MIRSMDHASNGRIEGGRAEGAQSVDRALALLMMVGARRREGARLADLVAESGLNKPTVRRLLLSLMRAGLVEQEETGGRYHLGPESYVLGTLAEERFGLHRLSLEGVARLAARTEDTAFVSIRRENYAICLHREEGAFPIRTHVLMPGDRHPLGVGSGSLAILAALPDEDVEAVIAANNAVMTERYPRFTPEMLRTSVAETRAAGYALNPGLLMQGSWGMGVAVRDAAGQPVGALSVAAIESRLGEARRAEVAALLQEEARRLEMKLADFGRGREAKARTARKA